jgi:FkbM family methyltransferase
MGFLSYAQNFEDVMLWRALGHVPNGVYVDVGAQHPRIDSVSRAFYERGWRGVHVEPVPAFAQLLREDRPDETVLQVALGEREGVLDLNVFADTGLSTAIPGYAERHQAERGYAVERIQTPVLTLKSALERLAGKDVHWLKIDVEGFEEQVLRGWDSASLRPWILVVEATVPNSTETDHDKWEHLVIAAGYRYVYFDGLNRFYIANEHPELAAAFSAPPNIFDAVEVSGQASWGLCNVAVGAYRDQVADLTGRLHARDAELADVTARLHASEAARAAAEREAARAAELDARLAALSGQAAAARDKVKELEHKAYFWWQAAEELRKQVDALGGELGHVYASKSWRVTEPLRFVYTHASRGRRFAGRVARWALRQTGRVARVVTGQGTDAAAGKAAEPPVVVVSQGGAPAVTRRLSPRAARLYAELKQVVERDTE